MAPIRMVLAVMACAAPAVAQQPAAQAPAVRVDGTSLVFASGHRWSVGLSRMRYWATLPGQLFVVSGFPCTECDIARRLYVLPLDADLSNHKMPEFMYPGTVYGEESPGPIIRSRAFVGVCGTASDSILLVAASSADTSGHWNDSSFVVSSRHGQPVATSRAGRRSEEATALRRVAEGVCREIAQVQRQFEG